MLAGRIWRRCRAAARVARVAAAPRRRWERGRMTVQPWSDPSGLSDLELAARIAARDRAAVRIVTERNKQRMFRVAWRSEEQTSELQSLMRILYADLCLNKKNKTGEYATNRRTNN